jgi:hypothetical protein
LWPFKITTWQQRRPQDLSTGCDEYKRRNLVLDFAFGDINKYGDIAP